MTRAGLGIRVISAPPHSNPEPLPQPLAQGAAVCQSHPKARPCCGAGGRKWDRDNAVSQPFLLRRHIPGDGDSLFLPGRGSRMFPGEEQTWPWGTFSPAPLEYSW